MTPTISQCSGENAPSNGTLRAYGRSSLRLVASGPRRRPCAQYRGYGAPRFHDAFCRTFSTRSTP